MSRREAEVVAVAGDPKRPKTYLKCSAHPRYKALRYPTSNCGACWRIWNEKKDTDV